MRKMEGSGCPCPDGIPAKSTAQMLSKVSQPLQIAVAPARLLFLPRLLKVASHCLTHSLGCESIMA